MRIPLGLAIGVAFLTLPAVSLPARAAGLRTGRSQAVVLTPPSPYPVRGSQGAALNMLYWAPLRSDITLRVFPLLQKLLTRFQGQVRLQHMSRFRQGTFYDPERYAALVGREAFAQGGDRLFWRYYDALMALPSLHILSNAVVDQAARSVGINLQRLQGAIARNLHEKAVNEENNLAMQLGVPTYNSSPVLLIGAERFYISHYTNLQHVETMITAQLRRAATWRTERLSAAQIHQRHLAEALKRYPPWQSHVSRPSSPSHLARSGRRYIIPVGKSPTRGPASAPITVVAFLDFTDQLSYNAWIALQGLLGQYPKQVRVIWKAMPRRALANALEAARSAYVAHAQGKFWELAQIFMQNRWRLSSTQIAVFAQQAGLDVPKFRRDAKDPRMAGQVLADMQLARRVGVTAAPGVFINGRRFLSNSYHQQELEPLIKQELQGGLLTRLLGE